MRVSKCFQLVVLAAAVGGCTFGGGSGVGSGADAGGDADSGADDAMQPTMGVGDGIPAPTDEGDGTTLNSGTASDSDAGATAAADGADTDPDGTTGGQVLCDPAPWFQSAWSARRALALDNTGVDAELTGFPVLLRLTPDRIDYDATQPDGGDVRVVLDDHTTVLPHQIEAWNDGGQSLLWFRMPSIPAEGTAPSTVYLYYGNPRAGSAGDGAAVWDEAFVSVHHMATPNDATAGGHDGFGPNLPTTGTGPVGPTAEFDGTSQYMALPNESDFDFTTQLTVSALVRVASFTIAWQAIVTKGDNAWRLHRQLNTSFAGFGTNAVVVAYNMAGDVPIDTGNWVHLAVVMDGITKRLFVNGEEDVAELAAFVDSNEHPVAFGENVQASGRFFHGGLDEIRISKAGRSAAWIATEARSLLVDDLVTYGDEILCTP